MTHSHFPIYKDGKFERTSKKLIVAITIVMYALHKHMIILICMLCLFFKLKMSAKILDTKHHQKSKRKSASCTREDVP